MKNTCWAYSQKSKDCCSSVLFSIIDNKLGSKEEHAFAGFI